MLTDHLVIALDDAEKLIRFYVVKNLRLAASMPGDFDLVDDSRFAHTDFAPVW